MTVRAPDSLEDFSTSSAVSNAVAFDALPSITSAIANQQYYLHEIAVTNTSATSTILRVLGNTNTRYNLPAPAAGGCIKTFDPALPIGHSAALRLQALDSASLQISLRAFKGIR
jgi:hypothetical protein